MRIDAIKSSRGPALSARSGVLEVAGAFCVVSAFGVVVSALGVVVSAFGGAWVSWVVWVFRTSVMGGPFEYAWGRKRGSATGGAKSGCGLGQERASRERDVCVRVARDEHAGRLSGIADVIPAGHERLRIEPIAGATAPHLEVQVHEVLAIERIGADDADRRAGADLLLVVTRSEERCV